MNKGTVWYSSLGILTLSLCCMILITSYGTSQESSPSEDVKSIEHNPIVQTKYGKLQGLTSFSREGREYKEFLGIPYATPPLGNLRYKAPQPPAPWQDVKAATSYGNKCIQFDMFTDLIVGSEDCLYLNVFTPKIPRKRKLFNWSYGKTLLPTLVYIHGGHFLYGGSDEYRPEYFMDEDVVVVTLNYRLNSFGFLNTGDNEVTGNMGLKDQNLALKWVKANIEAFGGDPNNVALSGQSAGGVSVHYHLLSPMSQGLFHSAISFSGSALSPWAITKNAREQANRLATSLDCPTNSTSDMVKCFRSLDAHTIVSVHAEIHNLLTDRLAFFTPTVESLSSDDGEAFLTETPHKLIRSGRVASKVPWMTGVTSEEGLIFLMGLFFEKESVENLNADWESYAPRLFYYEDIPKKDRNRISTKIRSHYLHNKAISEHYSVQNAEQLFSDANFNQGLRSAALAHSKLQPTYLYYFSHKGTFGFYQAFQAMSRSVPKLVDWAYALGYRWFHYEFAGKDEMHFGACHGDDSVLLWKIPLLSHLKTDSEDYYVSKAFIRSIVAFAQDRSLLQYEGIQWKPVNADDTDKPLKLMRIDTIPGVVDEPFFRSLSFWRQEIDHDIQATRDYHALDN